MVSLIPLSTLGILGSDLDVKIDDGIDTAITTHVPGSRLGYAELLSPIYSTATSIGTATDVAGLSVVVVGTGRPVDVEFFAPSVVHQTANTLCYAHLIVNGASTGAFTQRGQSRSSASASAKGDPLFLRRSLTLVSGTSYTFTVRLYSDGVAGTIEAYGQANLMANTLEVIAR